MGRFESPIQVAGLFLAASVVSVGVIFFINAEAHSRLSSHHPPHPEPYLSQRDNGNDHTESWDESNGIKINDASLSSPSFELTLVSDTNSNYNASSSSSEVVIAATNMTLLNFLEDGLTKLLSLIKQAKKTYKSYYNTQLYSPAKVRNEKEEKDNEGVGSKMRKYSRRKRQVITRHTPPHGRRKRAVLSNKRRRVGENEPYYWQMLEDNEHQEEKQGRRHNQKELPANTGHYSYSQNNHYPHNQFGSEGNHYPASGGVAPPAVASAFKSGDSSPHGGSVNGGGGGSSTGIISSPTSDFHKIRHAMNKLGGGGLDISVVERMILDTKSSSRSTSSQQQQQQQHNRNDHHYHHRPQQNGPTSSRSNQGGGDRRHPLGKGHFRDGDGKAISTESLAPTATTKTTHQTRQDESLYVNQLRHQQQQLAQSLLPPTVTWFQSRAENQESEDNGVEGTLDYLPLPSSSLSTGGVKTVNKENESQDDNEDVNEDDSEESGENSVDGRQHKKMIPSLKKSGSRRANELSSSSPSRSSAMDDNTKEFDYSLPFTTEEDEEDNNNNSDNKNKNNIDSVPSPDEDDPSRPIVLMGSPHHSGKDCYRTDDVLIVVAITCCLNFAFVLVIWALVRWFSISNNPKEKDFQNLGDCDDNLDPTIVFHGVAEDPCWTLANSEAAGKCDGVFGGPVFHPHSGLMTTRSCSGGGGGIMGHAAKGRNNLFSERGTLPHSMHHAHGDDDIFPMMGKHRQINGTGSSAVIMSERRGNAGGGMGVAGYMSNGGSSISSVYSFRPEHVKQNTLHRSYSQSMEDLRYIQ